MVFSARMHLAKCLTGFKICSLVSFEVEWPMSDMRLAEKKFLRTSLTENLSRATCLSGQMASDQKLRSKPLVT